MIILPTREEVKEQKEAAKARETVLHPEAHRRQVGAQGSVLSPPDLRDHPATGLPQEAKETRKAKGREKARARKAKEMPEFAKPI